MDYGLKRNGKRESRERRGRRFSYLPAEQVIMQLTTVLSPYESLMDFMDEITARRIELLQENQNASEYLGTRVTTKTLYDTVVGIGNVEIRLYKIEEKIICVYYSQQPALLYETDIFADRAESRFPAVLIIFMC